MTRTRARREWVRVAGDQTASLRDSRRLGHQTVTDESFFQTCRNPPREYHKRQSRQNIVTHGLVFPNRDRQRSRSVPSSRFESRPPATKTPGNKDSRYTATPRARHQASSSFPGVGGKRHARRLPHRAARRGARIHLPGVPVLQGERIPAVAPHAVAAPVSRPCPLSPSSPRS